MALFQVDSMGGLLSPEMQDQVKNQTLLSLGLGLLQGSGPSATPTSLGQLIGQAGAGALQQGQSLTDRAISQALRGRQIKKDQDEEDRLKRARESAAGAIPANLRGAFMDDPATATAAANLASAMSPKLPDPKFVKDFKLPDGSTISGYVTPQGFAPIGGAVAPDPTNDEKKQVLALRTAQDTLNDLKGTFSKTGTEVLPTTGKTKLQSQYRNLQLQLKELFNLGVLNGPDLDLMNQVLIDPTAMGSSLLGNERIVASMDEVQRFIKNKEQALLKSPGIRSREGNSILNNGGSAGAFDNATDDDLMSVF